MSLDSRLARSTVLNGSEMCGGGVKWEKFFVAETEAVDFRKNFRLDLVVGNFVFVVA